MSTPSKYLIYALVDPRTSEIRYIGKSGIGLARPKNHVSLAQRGEPTLKSSWIRLLLSEGTRPVVRVLWEAPSHDGLYELEMFLIAEALKLGMRLTNGTSGGPGTTGLKRSADAIAKTSAANRGRKHTPEAIEKSRLARTGAKRSSEARKRISDSMRGKPRPSPSEATRAKIAAANTGHKHSPETLAKISKNSSGRVFSEASRERMSQSQRRRRIREAEVHGK